MISFKNIFIVFISTTLFLVACNSDEPSSELLEWKNKNANCLTNMKDSVGFIKDTAYTSYGNEYYYYYKILQAGNSDSKYPLVNSYVKVNYRGALIDGTVFDQTYKAAFPTNDSTASPVSFYNNQLIPGWTLNIMQMKTAEIRTIVIPYEMGYGVNGIGNAIPPYSTLRFDIQLISYK